MTFTRSNVKLELQNPFKRMFDDNLQTAITDPMVKLGYGVCAYRDIVFRMLVIFSLFTLMVLPQCYLYLEGTGYGLSADLYN